MAQCDGSPSLAGDYVDKRASACWLPGSLPGTQESVWDANSPSFLSGQNQLPMGITSAENSCNLLIMFMYRSREGNNLGGKLHCQSLGVAVLIPNYFL